MVSRCSSLPLAASHSRAVLSELAVRTVRPSGLNDAAHPAVMREPLQFLAAGGVPQPGGLPLAVRTVRPSGLNDAAVTAFSCGSRCNSLPLRRPRAGRLSCWR